jgi:HK97 family phage portal protein
VRLLPRRREQRSLSKATLPPAMFPSDVAASTVTPGNAMAVADVFACVRALSDAAASLPLVVYRRADSGRERVDNATAALLRNPAPSVTQSGLVGTLVAHLNLFGNAFLGKFRGPDGSVAQLGCLRPDSMQVEMKGGRPIYTYQAWDGTRTTHTPDDIVHIKALSTDGLIGLSPVKQCRVALGLSDQLVKHASEFFGNSARPSGILSVPPGPGSEDHLSNLDEAWNERHAGSANRGRIAVLRGDVSFEAVSMPMDDIEFIQQRALSATEVARIFRVPGWIVNAPSGGDSLTYANTEQQALSFITYSLRPWLVAVEQALTGDADLFAPNTYCEFLLDGLLRSDAATRWSVYGLALDHGVMTVDEVRERENLPPLPADTRPVPTAPMNGNGSRPTTLTTGGS